MSAETYAAPEPPAAPVGPTPVTSPAQPGWAARNWPNPAAAAPWPVVVLGALTGAVAALTYVDAPPGTQVAAVVWLAAATTVVGSRAAAGARPVSLSRRPSTVLLGVLTLALGSVAVVRDAPWLIALCLTAALGTGSLVAVEGRSWSSMLMALPVLGPASARATAWTAARVRLHRREGRGSGWVRGLLIGLALLWVLAALLASADAVFGRVIGSVLPDIGLASLVGRAAVLVLVTLLVLGLAVCAASPPRWERLAITRGRGPAAEWAIPLALGALVLGGFVAVQVVALVNPEIGLAGTGLTPAERARQGFGQLVAVTLLTAAALGWAGRRSDPGDARHRWLLAGLGGLVTLQLLGVVATALARMWSYENVFGWSVMRLLVATFEGWLGAVAVLAAIIWALRATRHLPRTVVASAALVLVALAVVNPEGFVADRNVTRFEQGKPLDTQYLSRLSDDAVPAIASLPVDERRCSLGRREPTSAAWYAFNLARHRAQPVLREHEPIDPYALTDVGGHGATGEPICRTA